MIESSESSMKKAFFTSKKDNELDPRSVLASQAINVAIDERRAESIDQRIEAIERGHENQTSILREVTQR